MCGVCEQLCVWDGNTVDDMKDQREHMDGLRWRDKGWDESSKGLQRQINFFKGREECVYFIELWLNLDAKSVGRRDRGQIEGN